MREVDHAVEDIERDLNRINDTMADDKKMKEIEDELRRATEDMEKDMCMNCDESKGEHVEVKRMSLATKSAKAPESNFASSFGYGAAAGAAFGAAALYLFNNKSKTTDGFERI